jgi:hypothetical protein
MLKYAAALVVVLLVLGLWVGPLGAQDAAPTAEPATPPAAEPASSDQSAEAVLNELLQRREDNPIIEPARPSTAAAADPRTTQSLGTAPGAAKPMQLKREGSFVVMRKGRIVRAEGGLSPWMFVFDADKDGLGDPPMYLSPCQALEDMESSVAEHGDRMVFTVSGQVYTYQQANYLLVTLWKLTPKRGNLEP